MTKYLNFLLSLTDSQQRDEIQRLVKSRSEDTTGNPLAEDMLKHPSVVELNQSLGFKADWRSEKEHLCKTSKFAVDPIEIGSPSFSDDLCIAPVLFRYENVSHRTGEIVSNLEYQLTVNTLVYIDDDREPMVGSVTCWTNQDEVDAEKAVLGDLQKKNGYINYLRALTPLQRRSAIYDLAALTWPMANPEFLSHPELRAAAIELGISDLSCADHEVGPIELSGDRCTVPIKYSVYGYPSGLEAVSLEDLEDCGAKYYVEVQILACISDRAPTGTNDIGSELSIEDMSFSFLPIEEHVAKNLMVVS